MCSENRAVRDPSSPAIRVTGVGKCFRVYERPQDRLLQALLGRRKQLYREFWALRDISFELPRGQTLGIVGRNGSGKSSLLQIICGTLTASEGEVQRQGRVGALLELGSGFNPEFTGRENVFLNAALLGLSRQQTLERLDAILGFADIGTFVDQPVKTYSSGMVMRLAFAVQAHVDPDILVVDEALAVGDELFQKKCYAQLETLKQRGASILLVTHSCPQIIQHCDVALLLHRGQARQLDRPAVVTVNYQLLSNGSDSDWDATLGPPLQGGAHQPRPTSPGTATPSAEPRGTEPRHAETQHAHVDPNLQPQSTTIYDCHGVEIVDLRILDAEGEAANVIPEGQPFCLEFHYRASEDPGPIACGCHLASTSGLRISGQIHPNPGSWITGVRAGDQWCIRFHFRGGLWPGVYFIGGGVWDAEAQRRFLHRVVDYRALRVLETGAAGMVGQCNLRERPAELIRQPPTCP